MAEEYSSERGTPKYPQCGSSKLTLRFTGSTLLMTGGTQPHHYPATSGRLPRYAPIPKGRYWIQPNELWHCDTLRQINLWLHDSSCNDSGWGMYRITIHPYPETKTDGRGGFFIHGGSHIGSAGCINLGLRIDAFVGDLQSELKQNETCYIPLNAD